MLKRNNFWLGTIIGLVMPGVVFVFAEILKKDISVFGKEDAFYLISLAANFFILRYYFRSDREDTAKGVVLSTFTATIIFFFLKARQ
jgi:hypothetical protein